MSLGALSWRQLAQRNDPFHIPPCIAEGAHPFVICQGTGLGFNQDLSGRLEREHTRALIFNLIVELLRIRVAKAT